jgi:hypothetical protein
VPAGTPETGTYSLAAGGDARLAWPRHGIIEDIAASLAPARR